MFAVNSQPAKSFQTTPFIIRTDLDDTAVLGRRKLSGPANGALGLDAAPFRRKSRNLKTALFFAFLASFAHF